jgi:transposase
MLHTSGVKPLEVGKVERERVRALSRSTDADWVVRDRVDMVLLAAAGWSAPRIGRHLGWHAASVRRVVAAWRARGQDALFRRLPGPLPDIARTRRIQAALQRLLHAPPHRSWTAAQLSAALAQEAGVKLSARQVRRYLSDMGASWRRTKMSLAHKQSPGHVAAAHRRLAALKKKPVPGGWTSTS